MERKKELNFTSLQFFTKETCPLCKNKAQAVSSCTLFNIIKKEYHKNISSLEGFYFCKMKNCEVVYFKGNELITHEKLIKPVGLKEFSSASTVCYCFNWSKAKMKEEILNFGKTNVIEDIKSKMQTDKCACEINNPSGKCCLKDIKEAIKDINKNL